MFEEEEKNVSLLEYNCKDCNSKFFTNDNNKFNNCIFCNSTNIDKKDAFINNKIKIIPFKKEYKDAVKDYNKKISFNPLVPISFRNKKNFSTLQKIYVPVLVTNISREGEVEFIGGEKGKLVGNELDETKKYDVVQKVRFKYIDVLLKITSKVDDDLFNSISNYDLSNITDVDDNYFDDSFYLFEDISLNDISNKGRDDVDKHSIKIAKNNVIHSLKKIKKDNTNIVFDNTRELLVPVFVMKVNYENKSYSYIMNGESGKSCITLPISIKYIVILSIVVFIIVFLLSYLIAYFL